MKATFEFTHKHHPSPRLSANQIGEYLTANATKRRNILRDAKFPPTMLLIRYDGAKAPLVEHLSSDLPNGDILEKAILSLRRKADSDNITDYAKQNCWLSTDAIESFQSFEKQMKTAKIKFATPHQNFAKLKISGVAISVSVDLLTERAGKKGGAMLIFSKPGASSKDFPARCQAIALLVYEQVRRGLKASDHCDPTICMAIDVFNAKIYPARAQQKMLLKSVETSCEEVATVWPTIKPPANYNGPPVTGLV